MTLDYAGGAAADAGCVTAHYVASIYRRGESWYTRALRVTGPGEEDEWRLRQITALVRPPGLVLHRDERLAGVLERLTPRGDYSIYVLDRAESAGRQLSTQDLRARGAHAALDAHLTVLP